MSVRTLWTPERDGHAPPYWRGDMPWTMQGLNNYSPTSLGIKWNTGYVYVVPYEAVYPISSIDDLCVELVVEV